MSFFSASFEPAEVLLDESCKENLSPIDAFVDIDEFERHLVQVMPEIARFICQLDRPKDEKSKKQQARERLQRLNNMVATKARTLFEKPDKSKRKNIRGRRPNGVYIGGKVSGGHRTMANYSNKSSSAANSFVRNK